MDTLLNDLKQGIRSLLKHRGFTAVALLTLAVGIGANTAIFSLVNPVLLKPLPYTEADRLAMIFEDFSSTRFPRSEVAAGNHVDWKSQPSVFDDMALLAGRSFNLTGEGEPEKVSTYEVTANFFSLLGVKPSLGRDFTAEDDKHGAAHTVILSDALWNRRVGLMLLMSFSGVALLLATLGIYGVLSYFVSQQTREIGVRVALGAQLSDILQLVLKKGLRVALIGIGIGLTAAFLATRLMRTLLFNVSPTDGLTFLAIALLLLGVALVACLVPERRATKIEPLVALRYE